MNTQPVIIRTLIDQIKMECSPVNREAAFDAMLDSEGEVNVAGLTFLPSQIWKEMDPNAYRCGVNDYADGEAWVEIDGETYDQREVEEQVQSFRDELESELSDLEAELEELLQDDDYKPDTEEESTLRGYILIKQEEIAAIEKDDFFN